MIVERTSRQPIGVQDLVEALPAGLVHARDERVVYCNEAFAAMLGEKAEDLVGRDFFSLVAPEHERQARERYHLRQHGSAVPSSWELELKRSDGTTRRVELEPRAIAPGEHIVLVREVGATLRDIELANRLSALALRLQRERSLEAVLRATLRGLEELGMRMHAFRYEDDALVADSVTDATNPRLAAVFREHLATTLGGFRFVHPDENFFRRLFEEGQAVYLDDVPASLVHSVTVARGEAPSAALRQALAETSARKGVMAPLFVSDQPWGAIFVGSDDLSTRDAATVALFVAQVASAMEVARRIDELGRANRGLRAIHEVARAGTEQELARVLPRLLEVAANATASDRAAIFLQDHERGELVLGGSHGISCEVLEELGRDSVSALNPFADVLQRHRPVVLGGLEEGSVREALLLPLQVHGRLCGVLCLGRGDERPYDEEQVRAVEPIAAQLAIQVENARLYSETRRRLDLLSVQYALSRTIAGTLEEGPLVDGALALLTDRLGADAGWIYASQEDRLVLAGQRGRQGQDIRAACGSELPLDVGSVCGRAALERRSLSLDLELQQEHLSPAAQALGIRHLVAIPLVVEDRLVGTLSVGRRGPHGFRDEEQQLIESCAVQLAVAMERTRLFSEERRRAQDLSRLNQLGGLIAQQLELPALLPVGVEHLVRLVDVSHVFLSLLEPDGGPLRVVASNLREAGVFDITLDRDAPSAAAAAVREMRPVLIEDAQRDPRASRSLVLRFGHRSLLAVPLISRGEAIGSIVLAETREGRRFHGPAIERAVAMANQLAAAIANARLFEEERHRVRELSLLSELGRIASGTLQREVLLSECLGHIRYALGFDAGAAWTVQRGGLERAAAQSRADDGAEASPLLEAAALRALEAAAPTGETSPNGTSVCALPLVAGAEVGGILAFSRKGRPVSDAELRTLAAAAPELGVALQNARLFDDARRRVEELRLLLDIGRAITGSLDLDQILETSANTLTRIIDGSNTFILLLDAGSGVLHGAACSNPAWRDDFRGTRIRLDEMSIAARCVRGRTPLSVNDVARSDYRDAPRVRLYAEKSVLALPLLVRGEPIGVVLVDDTRQPRDWQPAEIERAALVAHQVAVAVANARLYDDLKRSYGELARTQEELVKRERLAALGELSAVVAHEVRNPLGVIFNSLGSMRKLLRPTGDGAMLLDIVEEEADRLDRIVRDLLDFARPHEPALEPEVISDLLADTLHAVHGDRVPAGVQVDLAVPDDLPRVRIDERMIRQVLLNLVLNGMQAMPRGGTLRIRAAVEQGQRPMVRIEFSDEGTGVPPELAPRIFQPFFTTKAAGTGLGLAVVKRFVEAHRGTITFQSRQGEGTTFTLRLPVDEAV